MIPIHLLAPLSVIVCYIAYRKSGKRFHRLASIALIFLILCKATTPLFDASANVALSSGELSDAEALMTLEGWADWHPIRTLFAGISWIGLGIMNANPKE